MSEALKREYGVYEEIGRGRFGVVHRCYSLRSGESFAVKTVDKSLLSDDSLDQQCLYNEVKAMQLVSPNPNIAQIYDVYEDESHLHFVLELCDSADLFSRIANRVLSEAEAVAVMVPFVGKWI